MSLPIEAGATSQSIWVQIFDKTTNLPATDVTHATAGLTFSYQRDRGPLASITPLSTLAAVNSAWAEGGLKHTINGYYRLDVPDAAFVAGVDKILFGGTATDYVIMNKEVPLVAAGFSSLYSRMGDPTPEASLAAKIAGINSGGYSAITGATVNGGLTGEVRSNDLVVYVSEAKLWTFTVTDDGTPTGNAIDLTGKTVKLIVEDGKGADIFSVAGTVSGDDSNIVSVQTAAGDHLAANVGTLYYILWNDTDSKLLGKGKYYLRDLYGEDA